MVADAIEAFRFIADPMKSAPAIRREAAESKVGEKRNFP